MRLTTKRFLCGIVLTFVFCGAAFGQNFRSTRTAAPSKKMWVVSILALAAANVFDATSSRGHFEANPLLQNSQGRFNTTRAIGFKTASTGGMLLVQTILVRRHPEFARTSSIANFIAAGALTASGARNSSIK